MACVMLEYKARALLSTMVTFSHQINVLSTVWCVRMKHNNIQDALALYNVLIAIVFYGVIVPLNGVSPHLVDFLVHVVSPTLFLIIWWLSQPNTSYVLLNRHVLLIYPALYLVFALFISYRRGYMLYPFFNPIYLVCVLSLLEILRFILAKIKYKSNTSGLS